MKMKKRLNEAIASAYLERIIRVAVKMPLFSKKLKNKQSPQVHLVGSSKMSRLNGMYRGKNKPTDVLSFPAPVFFQKQGILGELVICTPVLRRQAKEQKHSLEAELIVLLVHGLLHLLGFDHEESMPQARAMKRVEGKLMEKIKPQVKSLISRAQFGAN